MQLMSANALAEHLGIRSGLVHVNVTRGKWKPVSLPIKGKALIFDADNLTNPDAFVIIIRKAT